jgi:hypothetical protein
MIPRRVALLLALAPLGCQPRYGPTMTSIRMKGGPPDATVIVDDQPIASLGQVIRRGMAVLPGRHRITVERDGYFPWDRAIDARGELIALEVTLIKIPE